MAKAVLISWVGRTDLRAPQEEELVGKGPIAQALGARSYDAVLLISDYPRKEVAPFLKWLRPRTKAEVTVVYESLSSPTNFGEIYEVATRVVAESLEAQGRNVELSFHLSPGTPAMAAVWIVLAKTRFPAELIESSPKHGVRTVSVPFNISAEFIPDLLRGPDERLEKLTAGLPPEAPEFADIIHLIGGVHNAEEVEWDALLWSLRTSLSMSHWRAPMAPTNTGSWLPSPA